MVVVVIVVSLILSRQGVAAYIAEDVSEPLALEANTGQCSSVTRLGGVSGADRGRSARRVRECVWCRCVSVSSVCASVSLSDSGRLAYGLSPYGVTSFVHARLGSI